jgi:hypothetical protein
VSPIGHQQRKIPPHCSWLISPLRQVIAATPSARLAATLNSAPTFSDRGGLVRSLYGAEPLGLRSDLVDAPPDRLRRFGLLGHAASIGRELSGEVLEQIRRIIPTEPEAHSSERIIRTKDGHERAAYDGVEKRRMGRVHGVFHDLQPVAGIEVFLAWYRAIARPAKLS